MRILLLLLFTFLPATGYLDVQCWLLEIFLQGGIPLCGTGYWIFCLISEKFFKK